MATQNQPQTDVRTATRDDIRHVLGAIDDTLVVKILSKKPSFADLSDAAIWVRGDGDAVARDQLELSATAFAIAEVLARDADSEPADEA
jgi:hypothetical protein